MQTDLDPTDFGLLRSQKWHARIRDAARRAGVDLPYFRTHEARAGTYTVIDGVQLSNFASYDYLGLNGDRRVMQAAIAAIEAYGTSVSASRLVAGERPFHRELERELADLYDTEDALSYVSGHATNVSVIGQLMDAQDLIAVDASIHNSVMLGAQLSKAKVVRFAHNDLDQLEALLNEHRSKFRRCLIVVEGLYSMEGDLAELPALIEIKRRHKAWLMVDEAHALGTLGQTGRGSAEHFGLDSKDIDIWMGTLSKTLASTGGYIAGSRLLIDYLRHSSPGFVFSVGLSAPASAAATEAIRILRSEPERCAALRERSKQFLELANAQGLNTGTAVGAGIVPLYMGDNIKTLIWAESLYAARINVLPILFPAVPFEDGLLRFFISSEHSVAQIEQAVTFAAQTFDHANRALVDGMLQTPG